MRDDSIVSTEVAGERYADGAAVSLPKSYRGLAEGVTNAEATTAMLHKSTSDRASSVRELRAELAEANARAERYSVAAPRLRAEISTLHEEATGIRLAHDPALRAVDAAERRLSAESEVLRRAVASRNAAAAVLKTECSQLKDLCVGELRAEVAQGRVGHESLQRALELAESRVAGHADCFETSSRRAQILEAEASARQVHRTRLAADVDVARMRCRNEAQELEELERRCRQSIATWWTTQRQCCENFVLEAEALRAELEQTQDALEYQARESARWRGDAFRSELSLRALLGEDAAAGLRALSKQCSLDTGNWPRLKGSAYAPE